MPFVVRSSFAALLIVVRVAFAMADDRAFDPLGGRDARNFPPDPQVDFTHLKLDMQMPDPASRSFTCDQTLTFRTPQRAVDRIHLDAIDLKVEKVTDLKGHTLSHRYDDKRLTVRFDPPLPPRTEAGILIHYKCSNPRDGMYFALPDEAYPDRPISIHTQGEPELNRHWFVSHDFPNEKMTTELIVTAPSNLKALSNGALVSREETGNELVRWHYRLSKPHVSYLVSLVAGNFSVVTETWRGKPVEYWVPPAQEKDAKRTFGKTPGMLEFFSDRLGYEYPWEKYAQAVVYNFNFGGMENTSATTLVETSTIDERAAIDSDIDGLIAHELAHQWFGDVITCNSWPHIWLNEGFATFLDAAWHEHQYGAEHYAHEMFSTMRDVAGSDDVAARDGVVWHHFHDPDDVFSRGVSNPYSKGASVIHMLRRSLGDELFWEVVSAFLKRHQFQPVETDDLRKVCDELSGRSYERFFRQWIYRPGSPHIKVRYEWDDRATTARVGLEQTQAISADAPAFAADVEVWFVDDAGKVIRRATAAMDGRFAEIVQSFEADEREPAQVVVDPHGAVLAKWSVDLPSEMLVRQARSGPTPTSRLNGISLLAEKDRDEARDALKSILSDESQHWTLRSEAARALGRMQRDAARDILIDALVEGGAIRQPRVRRAAVEALGHYRGGKVVPTLLRFAKSDPTYTIEAVASTALGKQEPTDEIVQTLLANTRKTPSFQDQIRTSAVEALAELGDQRGLAPAMELARYGQPYRSRESAIEAIGTLGAALDDDEAIEKARKFLVSLLNDPQDRSAVAAIRALGAMGDEAAVPDLQRVADGSARKQHRDEAKSAIDSINRGAGESATVRSLRERIESLERAREREMRGSDEPREEKGRQPASAPATRP
jgi:aminopeptidase N